jgi:hypothetical protein
MTSAIRTTSINGQTYEFWGDFIMRGTMAKNIATGEVKQITHMGYASKDLTVRKYIASAFKLDTFRK